jgi:predicted phosphohydrolase
MSTKISVQIYSDIHIELWNKLPVFPVKAKYLFLAGNICKLRHQLFYKFFDYCSSNWEKIFYVPGNHEYYSNNKNYNELLFEYKYELNKKYKNVYFLDNECVQLDNDINVYGSTFWTKSPFNNIHQANLTTNDYNMITYFNQNKGHCVKLDIDYVNQLSKSAYNKIEKYLNETNKKTIVITHFPPLRSGTSNPKYLAKNRISNLYFSWPNETINNLNLINVPIWISGHTKWSYNFKQDNCDFVGNQLGYKYEYSETGINEDGLFEI